MGANNYPEAEAFISATLTDVEKDARQQEVDAQIGALGKEADRANRFAAIMAKSRGEA